MDYKYLLTKYVLLPAHLGGWGKMEILGTFSCIQNANRFLWTSPDYGDDFKFISCRQIIERPDASGNKIKLDLTSVPYNPIDKIGELQRLIEDEPSIQDFIDDPVHQEGFVEHQLAGISFHPYVKEDEITLQLWGWSIRLFRDGTWFFEATDGG